MVGISYELQAFFVDNAAAEGAATEILIDIDGSRGKFRLPPEASDYNLLTYSPSLTLR